MCVYVCVCVCVCHNATGVRVTALQKVNEGGGGMMRSKKNVIFHLSGGQGTITITSSAAAADASNVCPAATPRASKPPPAPRASATSPM